MNATKQAQTQHDPMLDVALHYQSKGIPVFPCRAAEGENTDWRTGELTIVGAKTPLTNDGFKSATINERLVRGLWERNAGAIVGIPTGEKLGAWVLDVDMHQDEHGNTIDGFAALSALESKHGVLPKTATVRTAGGGEHRYFRHVAGVRNRGSLGAGLDVRGDGGYVIAAGSVLTDGRSYEWLDHTGDGLPDIADAPEWLLDLVLPRSYESTYSLPRPVSGEFNDRYVERAVDSELQEVASIPMGAGRNVGLNKAAFALGTFVGAGALDESEARSLLQDVARGWGRDWVKCCKTIESGLRSGIQQPRQLPEPTLHDNDNTPLVDLSRLIANGLAKGAASVAIINDASSTELPFVIPAIWHGKVVPEREWWLDGLVPMRQVTILNGDGGVGKSLLALQLAAAGSMGCATLEKQPMHGRVMYLGAEDEAEEFHRRLVDITRSHHRKLSDLEDFKLLPLADADALLSLPNAKSGVMEPTPLWKAFAAEARVFKPALIVLDTAADLFGGDEVKRAQVRQFVSMLRKLAIEISCAIILLAHPSVAGMQNGTGSSGSTAWNNSVRSRLYLTRPDAKDDPDPDARVLKTMKTNYGKVGGEIKIRWEEGAFMLDDGKPSPAAGILQANQEQTFLRLLSEINRTGQRVSASRSSTYAPTVMEGMPNAEGVDKKGFEAAMRRLFASDQIRVVMEGPQSKSRQRLVVIAEEIAAKRMQAE